MERRLMRSSCRSSTGELLSDHPETSWCKVIGCYPIGEKNKVEITTQHFVEQQGQVCMGKLWLKYVKSVRGEVIKLYDGLPGVGVCIELGRVDLRPLIRELLTLAEQLEVEAN